VRRAATMAYKQALMKRRAFLQSLPLIADAVRGSAESTNAGSGERKPVLVRSGFSRQPDGTEKIVEGQQTLIRSSDSEAKLVSLVLPVTVRTPYRGAPLHVHHDVDEWIYILGGEFVAQVGDQRLRLRTGDSLLLPMRIPHRWSIAQSTTAGAIHLYTPAGLMDTFFDPDPPGTKQPTWEEQKAIFENHQVTLLGPPLTQQEIDSVG
jgi:mannose-6-phosphate isomerase-like protein (cupin superfamily)